MSALSSGSGGIGFMIPLTILFIALKLTSYIDWSWWWVLAPLWLGFLITFILTFVFWMFFRGLPK